MESRTALVTGAASGIGLAIAEALAEQGCRLLLADLERSDAAAVAERLDAHFIATDLARPEDCRRLTETALKHCDAVDILVNNAGLQRVSPIEDFPDEETLADMGIDDPFGLLGLYHGIPLTERSLTQPSAVPDMIFLYRRPLLDAWAETEGEAAGTTLYDLIRHVLIHEIGHHYGFSDADMDRIEAE